MVNNSDLSPVDIVIVGSGASGAAAAWSLSRSLNLKVLCIEQGKRTRSDNYPSVHPDWELKRKVEFNSDPNIRKNAADYPVDNSNSPISLANFNGFGGSTILYSGHFPRFHPSDFMTKSLDGIGMDWPIKYEDLKPYFSLNEKMMGVAGLVGDPANPYYESLLPPVPLGLGGQAVAEGFNKLGWHWWPSYSAINTKKHLGRASCINLGPCNTGCAQGAKGSVDLTYWPLAIKQGVEVRTECTVYDIVLSDDAYSVKGIRYIDSKGEKVFQEAGIVILACSGAGTPRLLLNSKSKNYPNGLLNNYDLVGRNLMLHPLAYVEGVFDRDINSSIGPQGCSLFSQEFYETNFERGFLRGYTMQILRGSSPLDTAQTGYWTRTIPVGKNHHEFFSRFYNRNMGIAIISEDIPEEHNRIELDYSNKDIKGVPGVKCIYTINENTKKILAHGISRAKEVFEASGARVTSSFSPIRHAGWHIMGTARMGDSIESSVVDKNGESHAVSNLYIVDSSVFVTSGAVNPVATAQAITLKICDYIINKLNKEA